VFLLNAHGRITGPNGTLDLNVKSPVATAPANPTTTPASPLTEPANPAPAR
jgi:hypothetical protein